jgi:hypothetical protein
MYTKTSPLHCTVSIAARVRGTAGEDAVFRSIKRTDARAPMKKNLDKETRFSMHKLCSESLIQ